MRRGLMVGGGLLLLLIVWFVFLGDSKHHDPRPKVVATPAEPEASLQPVETPTLAPTNGPARKPDTSAVRSTIRAFLKEYLPYSYGNGHPAFKSASEQFRADLLAQPPNVPERIRKLTARVVLVQVDYVEGRDAQGGAMVKDSEGAEYPVRLRLGLIDDHWYVTAIGG